jgi:hypothetical protein
LYINNAKSGIVTNNTEEEKNSTQGVSDFPMVTQDQEYKYLGFKQHWNNTMTTKEAVFEEARKRIKKLVFSPLTLINIGKLMLVYAAPLIRFVGQCLRFTDSELDELTRFARVQVKRANRIPWKISNGRVHARPEVGGFGLPDFKHEYWLETLAVAKYLKGCKLDEVSSEGDSRFIRGKLAENIVRAQEWLIKRSPAMRATKVDIVGRIQGEAERIQLLLERNITILMMNEEKNSSNTSSSEGGTRQSFPLASTEPGWGTLSTTTSVTSGLNNQVCHVMIARKSCSYKTEKETSERGQKSSTGASPTCAGNAIPHGKPSAMFWEHVKRFHLLSSSLAMTGSFCRSQTKSSDGEA